VALADRLDPRQDRVLLVEQEPAEVGEVGAAIQVVRRAPRAGNPAVIQLNLPRERECPVADDTSASPEGLAADARSRPALQGLMRYDLAFHPLPANLCQQRIGFRAVDPGFYQPDGTHTPWPRYPLSGAHGADRLKSTGASPPWQTKPAQPRGS